MKNTHFHRFYLSVAISVTLILLGLFEFECFKHRLPTRTLASSNSTRSSAAAINQLNEQGNYTSLAAAMAATRYHLEWHTAQTLPPILAQAAQAAGGAWQASNPAQGLDAWFNGQGLLLQPQSAPDEKAAWRVGLELTSYGYGKSLTPLATGTMKTVGNRIEIQRPAPTLAPGAAITEWYVNQAEGLEQGFTLHTPPAGPPRGAKLRLTLRLASELHGAVAANGQALLLKDNRGTAVLSYDKLTAWDQTGRVLGATMSLTGQELALEIDAAGAVYPVTIDPVFMQQTELTASDGAAFDFFGTAVALDGDTAVVGAPNANAGKGAVYVFTRNGMAWTQQQKLTGSDSVADDRFGSSVSINGNTLVVGADTDDNGANVDQGSAYVFVRSGILWTQQQKLISLSGDANDRFGISVALSGDTAVIGAYGDDIGVNQRQGSATVFVRSGTTWSQQQLLTASDGSGIDEFGWSVAINGETVLVGALTKDLGSGLGQRGAAYVFTRNVTTWSQQQRLTASDGAVADQFGSAVALSGNTAIVGARGNWTDNPNTTKTGAAYVFQRRGANWAQLQKLTAADAAAGDSFGQAVTIEGDTLVIGAYLDDVGSQQNQGAAYVYSRTGSTWSPKQKLLATGGQLGDQAGVSVALSNQSVIAGAHFVLVGSNQSQGAAFVFKICGDLVQQQKLTDASGSANDELGTAVAISGNLAVVGIPKDNLGPNQDQGSALVFVRNNGIWSSMPGRLMAANGAAGDLFGAAVAIHNNSLVIGAPGHDFGNNTNQGSAYVFVLVNNVWTQQAELVANDGAAEDGFGNAVSINRDTVVIGAEKDRVGTNDFAGSAYVFTRTNAVWSLQAKLASGNLAAFDSFGSAVAIDGETIAVGAPFKECGLLCRGVAYVFVRTGTVWSQQASLLGFSPAVLDTFLFGTSVALSNDTLVVGARDSVVSAEDSRGSAYVFTRSGSNWGQSARLGAPDSTAFQGFGGAVAIEGDTLVVGAAGDTVNNNSNQGSAYVFNRAGLNWNLQLPKLTANDGATSDSFGVAVSVSGDSILVGAHLDDVANSVNQGSAYVYACAGCPALTLTPATLPAGTAGTAYNQTITATGGTGPYQFSFAAGVLPPGLTLSSTGQLFGTPSQAGTYSFTVIATMANLCSGARTYSVTIGCPILTVNPATLPNGIINTGYSQLLTITGGTNTATFNAVPGALPAGLTLSPTGLLSGTPTAFGTTTFTVTAVDGNGCPGIRTYTLTIGCPTIVLSPASLSSGIVNSAYSQTLTATGGSGALTFTLLSGTLPNGLTLSSAGLLTGTPTQAGTFNITVRVQEVTGCVGLRPYTLMINCQTLGIAPQSLPNPSSGVPYNQTLTASNAVGAVTFSLQSGTLPIGLTLSSAGVIAGTTSNSSTFTVKATDANGCLGTRTYALTVGCGTVTITPTTLPAGIVGVSYAQGFSVSGLAGGPPTWSLTAGALPPGLTQSSTTGAITGFPTTPGSYSFVVQVSNGVCSGTAQYTLDVTCPALNISPTTLPNGTVNALYAQTLTQTGNGIPAWSLTAGSLPAGLSLNAVTGQLSGTPSETGNFSFTVTATNLNNCAASRVYTLAIGCQTLTVTPTSAVAGTVGTSYSQVFLQNAGVPPFTFNLSSGTLPPGLAFTTFSFNGLVSGVPTQSGSFTFTVKVTDKNGCTGTRDYTINIGCPTLSISPANVPAGTAESAYEHGFTQTGGTGAITWSLTGALPNGLFFDSLVGTLTGTPTQTGTFPLTVNAVDAAGCMTSQAVSLSIDCPALTLSPAAQAFNANGGTSSLTITTASICPWTVTPDAPWLSLTSAASGSGTSIVNFSVSPNPGTTPRTGTITVAGKTFFVEQAATGLLAGTSFTDGIPPDWTVIDGGTGGGNAATWTTADPCLRNLFPPPGNQYAIVDSSCAGPNAVQDEQLITPPFNVTGIGQVLLQFDNQFHWLAGGLNEVGDVDVSTNNGANWQNVLRLQSGDEGFPLPNVKTINITAACALNPANVRVRFRYYTTDTALPKRLGRQTTTARPASPLSQELWWGIDRPTILGFTLNTTSQSFPIAGGTVAVNIAAAPNVPWAVENLPPWITAMPTSGTGTGTVRLTVEPNFTNGTREHAVKLANNAFTVTQAGCSLFSVNPPSLPNGILGMPYSQQLTQNGGSGSLTWNAIGTLPNNVTLNALTGLLAGTPTTAGTFNFTARVTDANGCFGERAYSITIGTCAVITLNPTRLANGFVGTAYSQTFTQSGGTGTLTWSVNAGSLPNGLNLNAQTGTLSGTPTLAGTFTFTIKVTDAAGCPGLRSYNLLISGNGLQFYPLAAPVRLLDTRSGASPNACSQPNAPLVGQNSRTQPARNFCTIPANAVALTGNVTTVQSSGAFLTLYPSDAALPTAASTNFTANEIVNNVFTVGLGAADGAFKIFAVHNTEVVIDVTGYYAPPSANGLYFHPLPAPIRLLETRPGEAGCVTPGTLLLRDTDTLQQAITPCTGIPATARAIVGNATTVNPQQGSYITLYPGNVARPFVATTNFGQGQTVNGSFTVGLAPTGEFKIYTTVTTDLVMDILGYYSTEALDANGAGLLFTPLASPVRLLETRADPANLAGCFKPNTKLNAQQVYTQTARGMCQRQTIAADALAVVGNATVVFPALSTHMTFWPSSAAQPNAATSNYTLGSIVNRHFIVGLGNADGAFKLISYSVTDLVIDLTGYFAP